MGMLYIHVPFCRRKCIYCDFFSGGASIADWEEFAKALIGELKIRFGEIQYPLTSIYFGGGTPSLMPPDLFSQLMHDIYSLLYREGLLYREDLNIDGQCPSMLPLEFTLECNPDDMVAEDAAKKLKAWKEAGVNRVSIGVQTFHDDLLKKIGRLHDGKAACDALRRLRDNFDNISADLIFGLPGQSLEMLSEDIDTLLEYEPEHVSVYSLMFEEGTALTALRDSGRLSECDEGIVADMYGMITARLHQAGYEHYEISNYAGPGRRSRHNSGYWRGLPYLGLGPSAHSFDGDCCRRHNPADIRGYIEHFAGERAVRTDPFYIEERLTREERIEEAIMLSLRVKEGIDLTVFEDRFGVNERERLWRKAEPLLSRGLLAAGPDGNSLHLSDAGVMIADTVIVELL